MKRTALKAINAALNYAKITWRSDVKEYCVRFTFKPDAEYWTPDFSDAVATAHQMEGRVIVKLTSDREAAASLAAQILATNELRETSFLPEKGRYTLSLHVAACQVCSLELREVVEFLLFSFKSDAISWAKRHK